MIFYYGITIAVTHARCIGGGCRKSREAGAATTSSAARSAAAIVASSAARATARAAAASISQHTSNTAIGSGVSTSASGGLSTTTRRNYTNARTKNYTSATTGISSSSSWCSAVIIAAASARSVCRGVGLRHRGCDCAIPARPARPAGGRAPHQCQPVTGAVLPHLALWCGVHGVQ